MENLVFFFIIQGFNMSTCYSGVEVHHGVSERCDITVGGGNQSAGAERVTSSPFHTTGTFLF